MKDVNLEGLSKHIEEATIQTWFFEEGDMVSEGDDLVELSTEEGTAVHAPSVAPLASSLLPINRVLTLGRPSVI